MDLRRGFPFLCPSPSHCASCFPVRRSVLPLSYLRTNGTRDPSSVRTTVPWTRRALLSLRLRPTRWDLVTKLGSHRCGHRTSRFGYRPPSNPSLTRWKNQREGMIGTGTICSIRGLNGDGFLTYSVSWSGRKIIFPSRS